MQFYEKPIPDYLNKKGNIVTLVLFTALFALVFINVYWPFKSETFTESDIMFFLYSSFAILTGMLVVAISRLLMYYYSRSRKLSYLSYIGWVIAEILVMAFVYAIYVKFILSDSRDLMLILNVSIKNTSLIILIPYTILWLFFSWRDNALKLEELQEHESPAVKTSIGMIPFRDEKGTLRLSVHGEDLLYLEAADNYVSVHYLHHDKVQKFMVRNSMKSFEEQFSGSNIIRCHRSHMVNLDRVAIIRKESDGLNLELDTDPPVKLLVSKTYVTRVMEVVSKISPLDN